MTKVSPRHKNFEPSSGSFSSTSDELYVSSPLVSSRTIGAKDTIGSNSPPLNAPKKSMEDALMTQVNTERHVTESNASEFIAARTRTKLSLVDVDISELESFLGDDDFDVTGTQATSCQDEDESEDQREYRRFLNSLLPTEASLTLGDDSRIGTGMDGALRPTRNIVDGSTSAHDASSHDVIPCGSDTVDEEDEEDDEYEPEEEDGEEKDEDHHLAPVVSRRELTELLWDTKCNGLTDPISDNLNLNVNVAQRACRRHTLIDSRVQSLSIDPGVKSEDSMVPKGQGSGQVQVQGRGRGSSKRMDHDPLVPIFSKAKFALTRSMYIQLTSQMHKHFQLLVQNSVLASESEDGAASNKAIQSRCEQLLKKLHSAASQAAMVKDKLFSNIHNPRSSREVAQHGGISRSPSSKEPKSELKDVNYSFRRITRSLSAAHAAFTLPSMHELIGIEATWRRFHKVLDRKVGADTSPNPSCTQDLRPGVFYKLRLFSKLECVMDVHLDIRRVMRGDVTSSQPHCSSIVRNKDKSITCASFSSTEDALLFRGLQQFGCSDSALESIHDYVLPTKSVRTLQSRFQLLQSTRSAVKNAVKELQKVFVRRHPNAWRDEEDCRLVRGMFERQQEMKARGKSLHTKKNDSWYSTITSKYLPHRTRSEVRRRWLLLSRSDLFVTQSESLEHISADVNSAHDGLKPKRNEGRELCLHKVKAFLLNHQLLRSNTKHHQGTKSKSETLLDSTKHQSSAATHKPPSGGVFGEKTWLNEVKSSSEESCSVDLSALNDVRCDVSSLHPALYYSSWAFTNPTVVFNKVCVHNQWTFFQQQQQQHILYNTNDTEDEPKESQFSPTFLSRCKVDLATGISGDGNGSEEDEEFECEDLDVDEEEEDEEEDSDDGDDDEEEENEEEEEGEGEGEEHDEDTELLFDSDDGGFEKINLLEQDDSEAESSSLEMDYDEDNDKDEGGHRVKGVEEFVEYIELPTNTSSPVRGSKRARLSSPHGAATSTKMIEENEEGTSWSAENAPRKRRALLVDEVLDAVPTKGRNMPEGYRDKQRMKLLRLSQRMQQQSRSRHQGPTSTLPSITSPDTSQPVPWSKLEDRLILSMVRKKGHDAMTWYRLVQDEQVFGRNNRSAQDVRKRYEELVSRLERRFTSR